MVAIKKKRERESQTCFLEKSNKPDTLLVRLIKEKKKKVGTHKQYFKKNTRYNSDAPDFKKLLIGYNEQKEYNQLPQNIKKKML